MRSVGKRAGDESGKHPVNEDDEESLRVPVKLRGLAIHGHRHCEEQSDEAIHLSVMPRDGLLRFARNDGERPEPPVTRSSAPLPGA